MDNVLITGAAGGIGRALCDVFHESGYRVIGVDKKKVEDPVPYNVIHYDISTLGGSESEAKNFHERVDAVKDGPLGVLINNAAVQVVKNIEGVNAADWKATLDTNLLAPFWLTQLFLADLRESKGNVINIASIHSLLTKARFSVYATSKGALVSMTRALALELAPDVRINAVIPAATDTPMLRAGFVGNPDGLETLGNCHPLGRIADPREVAQVAKFLAGKEASFITGAALHVDGGIGGVLHDPVTAR